MNDCKIQKAIFLDRDGVINEDFGYVYEIENFIFKDGIFKAVQGFMNYFMPIRLLKSQIKYFSHILMLL